MFSEMFKKEIKSIKEMLNIGGGGEEEEEGFGNLFGGFHMNGACIVITLIFIVIFMYKEELMKTKVIKDLVK